MLQFYIIQDFNVKMWVNTENKQFHEYEDENVRNNTIIKSFRICLDLRVYLRK